MLSWIALATGTFAAGAGMAFLGSKQRWHAAEREFLAQLTGLLEVNRGMAESLRLILTELVRGFDCGEAIMAFRDMSWSASSSGDSGPGMTPVWCRRICP